MISKSSKKHFEAISREVNDCGFYPHEVGHLLTKDHRYLQGEFAKMAFFFLFELGENYEKGWYDARNECMAKTAFDMVKAARDGLHIRENYYGDGYHRYDWDNDLSGTYYSYTMRKQEREQKGED